MTQEDYVSFNVAKLLKEKGYNEPCKQFYCKAYDDTWNCDNDCLRFRLVTYSELEDGDILIPSLYDAQKWLREKHGIIVDIDTDYYDGFLFTYQAWSFDKVSEKQSFDTYEEALNEGIKEALKMI